MVLRAHECNYLIVLPGCGPTVWTVFAKQAVSQNGQWLSPNSVALLIQVPQSNQFQIEFGKAPHVREFAYQLNAELVQEPLSVASAAYQFTCEPLFQISKRGGL